MAITPDRAASESRLFAGIPERDRDAILAGGYRQRLRKGQVLLRQGDAAAAFYLVDRGYLKLTQVASDGAELIVRFVGPGDPVGGVAALDSAPYPLTASACESAEVLGWSRPILVELLGRVPQLRSNIMREMSRHMADALTRVREMATTRVSQRLARALLRLADHCGRRTGSGIEIPHSLTRQDLAALTGTTLFTVSRTLADWEAAGTLRSSRGRVEILDTTALRRHAEEP